MRIYPIVTLGLLLALPAHAQQGDPPAAAPAKPEAKPEPAKPEPAKPDPAKPEAAKAEAAAAPDAAAPEPAAPAAEAEVDASATLGADAGAGATAAAATGGDAPVVSDSPSSRGPAEAAADTSWKLEYHGYFRAPMRMGIGKREGTYVEGDPATVFERRPGQSATTFHYPVIPDDQYLSWQSTSHNKKDWAEMFFTYGNSLAQGTLALQGFNFTDAAWTQFNAQFGISQGYLTLTPDLGYENMRLIAKAGVFWARYGMAGKWDAGEYDTYLFGRTHVAGELIRVEFEPNLADTLWFEHGIGVKRPDPSQFNNARFTVLNHAHVGYKLGSLVEASVHYINAFAQEEDRNIRSINTVPAGASAGLIDEYNPPNYPSTLLGVDDGDLKIYGGDLRFELGAFGYFYVGYSHIAAENAISVAPAVEVLHAFGGGQFQLGVTDNYFGPSCEAAGVMFDAARTNTVPHEGFNGPLDPDGTAGPLRSCSMGTGSVDTVLAQYDFSLTNFLDQSSGGQKFWGEGQDLKVSLYGMLNMVSSDVDSVLSNGDEIYDGITKLKYGTDVQVQILPWLTAAARYDRVQPNSRIPEQSFGILSPRLVFKSTWVTREQISVQYSRYLYNRRECDEGFSPANQTTGTQGIPVPGHPWDERQLRCTQPPAAAGSAESFGSHYESQEVGLRGAPTTRPDVNVIKIDASMWW